MKKNLGSLCVKFNSKDGCTVINSVGTPTPCTLDRIFNIDTAQDAVFEEVAKGTVSDVLRGYNGTIFTYGQSGSGKLSLCME